MPGGGRPLSQNDAERRTTTLHIRSIFLDTSITTYTDGMADLERDGQELSAWRPYQTLLAVSAAIVAHPDLWKR
jgi:hypothetical protein